MRTDIERFFCAPPSGNCCNAEIRRRVCGCDFPRQTPSSGTAGISLTKHRINAILIHGRRARYVRFCRSGFSAAQSGKRSGAGLRRDVEAAFLTRPAIRYCTAHFTGLCPERHSPVRMTEENIFNIFLRYNISIKRKRFCLRTSGAYFCRRLRKDAGNESGGREILDACKQTGRRCVQIEAFL